MSDGSRVPHTKVTYKPSHQMIVLFYFISEAKIILYITQNLSYSTCCSIKLLYIIHFKIIDAVAEMHNVSYMIHN